MRLTTISVAAALLTTLSGCDNGNAEVLAAAAAEPGAIVTDSGLVYLEVLAGTGAQPLLSSDAVKVIYEGRFPDGEVFDSGTLDQFRLDQVIDCWTEGVMRMREGGRAKLTCPPEIAYGPGGTGGIPGNAVLIFDVELLNVYGR